MANIQPSRLHARSILHLYLRAAMGNVWFRCFFSRRINYSNPDLIVCAVVVSAFKRTFCVVTLCIQICRNINRIKVCMETGRTVILLNLESLYESLYDALNQVCVYPLLTVMCLSFVSFVLCVYPLLHVPC